MWVLCPLLRVCGCVLHLLVYDILLCCAFILLGEWEFTRCVFVSFLVLLCLFVSLDVRGRLFYNPPFLYTLVFLIYFSAGFLIRRKLLFCLMSGEDFLNIPPFLYILFLLIFILFAGFSIRCKYLFYLMSWGGFFFKIRLSFTLR